MAIADVISQIDSEIAKLQQAKTLLSGGSSAQIAAPAVKNGRGRPKGSKNAAKTAEEKAPAKSEGKAGSKRTLSPEGRKAIADAMKRRWAQRREQSGK